jgi:hypothetical protein
MWEAGEGDRRTLVQGWPDKNMASFWKNKLKAKRTEDETQVVK